MARCDKTAVRLQLGLPLCAFVAWTLIESSTSTPLRHYRMRFTEEWERIGNLRENQFRVMSSQQKMRDGRTSNLANTGGDSAASVSSVPLRLPSSSTPWMPTDQSNPLPIHHIIDHPFPGKGGLNNILWSHAYALNNSCRVAKDYAITGGPAGDTFAAVILPNLLPDISMHRPIRSMKRQHRYSDIFDIDTMTRMAIEELQCFVTDLSTLESLSARGLVVLAPPDQLTISQHDGHVAEGRGLQLLYSGLAPSERLQAWIAPCIENMSAKFGGSKSRFLAVHVRVEDDYLASGYCAKRERRESKQNTGLAHPIRYCFNASEIADIMLRTVDVAKTGQNLVVHYADRMFRSNARHLRTEHPLAVWPPHWTVTSPSVLQCLGHHVAGDRLTYTEEAAVSFFLAVNATFFMGARGSTMSRGIARYRIGQHQRCKSNCEDLEDRLNNYAYDCGAYTGLGYARASKMFFGPKNECPMGSCCLF